MLVLRPFRRRLFAYSITHGITPGICQIAAFRRFVNCYIALSEDRDIHFAGFRSYIGKRIEDMGQVVCRQVLGLMISSIDSP